MQNLEQLKLIWEKYACLENKYSTNLTTINKKTIICSQIATVALLYHVNKRCLETHSCHNSQLAKP